MQLKIKGEENGASHMRKIQTFLFPLFFLLTGCAAHLSEKQCLAINWYDKGYQDGAKGDKPHKLQSAINDCARFNLRVNTEAYHNGHTAGAHVFCNPKNGFKAGTQGKVYQHVCTQKEEKKFLTYYRRGLRRYCTPSKGYQLGRIGNDEPSFCAPDLRAAFNLAYQRGRTLYNTEQALQTQVDSISTQIISLDLKIPDDPKTKTELTLKDSLQDQINTLYDTKESLQNQLLAIRRQ